MKPKRGWGQFWEILLIAAPAIIMVTAAFWMTSKYIKPAPPSKIVIATSSKGAPYHRLAEKYRDFLAANGVTMEIRETGGSFDNLRLLKDPASDVDIGFVQGGITNAAEAPGLRSIGRMFWEPLWLFTRHDLTIERLPELVGKRILVGPAGGGTNFLAVKMLEANGVTPANSTFINMELPQYVETLQKGEADAGFLVLGPDAKTIGRLFEPRDAGGAPRGNIVNLAQADAFTQRFAFLSRLDLKRGVIDFGRDVPAANTAMVTTAVALVAREELHPALASLMAQAALQIARTPDSDPTGRSQVFSRESTFPTSADPEFPMVEEARRIYTSGPPFLQRFLPFWLATLADRLFVLLLPIIGVAMPLMKLVPMMYTWRIRRRIFRWYGELRRVEVQLSRQATAEEIAELLAEVDRIKEAAHNITVPVSFASSLYDLREHIDVTRRRVATLQDRRFPLAAAG